MGNEMYVLSAGLEFFFATVSIVLLAGCLLDHDRKRRVNRIMIAILAVHALMNVIDACIWLWCDVPELLALIKTLSFLSYGMGSAIFAMLSYLVVCYIREYASVSVWITRGIVALGTVMALLWVISLFNGMYYYWDENGACQLGELYPLSQLFGVCFLLFNIVLVLCYRRALARKDCAVLILYSAIPLLSFVFVPMWDVVPLYMASTIALLLYYIVIHVEHGQRAAEQQARLARQELELTNSRTAIVLSQVKPHFLYNTLTAIAQLCQDDPRQAMETTIDFAEYLRRNMNALTQTELISFDKELEHVRTYLAIERVRSGGGLRIEYDIGATDFALPPLCLQPIVENAVKHGVGMTENGGTVKISTAELPDGYDIVVCDDGAGFDPEHIPDDGRAHIGIPNARERLLKLVGADMRIESETGRGTSVTIHIPKREAGL